MRLEAHARTIPALECGNAQALYGAHRVARRAELLHLLRQRQALQQILYASAQRRIGVPPTPRLAFACRVKLSIHSRLPTTLQRTLQSSAKPCCGTIHTTVDTTILSQALLWHQIESCRKTHHCT